MTGWELVMGTIDPHAEQLILNGSSWAILDTEHFIFLLLFYISLLIILNVTFSHLR